MLCRDGKVSLASFLSGIITTVTGSLIILSFSSIELNSIPNVLICFSGSIGMYAVFCLISYFVTTQNDFSVRKPLRYRFTMRIEKKTN